mgnify:CR=1 FL=1
MSLIGLAAAMANSDACWIASSDTAFPARLSPASLANTGVGATDAKEMRAEDALASLGERIHKSLNWNVEVPKARATYDLT